LFPVFNLRIPVLYPRISATMIEPRINRHLKKYQIEPAAISRKKSSFIAHYFKQQAKKTGSDPIAAMQKDLMNRGERLETYLNALDPTLVDVGKKSMEKIQHIVLNLENRVLHAREQKDSVGSTHLQQVHTAFYPGEMPQERFLSLIYFLNKFGPEFTSFLLENLDPDQTGHQLLLIP
jgi:uncharacterized protein YllA (UPF0747 family)